MITYPSNDSKEDKLNLLYVRNTINRDLIASKASARIQVTGNSWNQKGNILLYTHSRFQSLDFDLHLVTITKAVQEANPQTLHVNKQETWYKVFIHGITSKDN